MLRVYLNIHRDSLHPAFETGTLLRIRGVLYKNKLPNNPNQLRRISFEKQIYAQLYADMDQISISTIFKRHLVLCRQLRTTIIQNLEKNNFHKKS
jgi:competence protein ComEC